MKARLLGPSTATEGLNKRSLFVPATDEGVKMNRGAVAVWSNWYRRTREKPPTLIGCTFHSAVPTCWVWLTNRPSKVSRVFPFGCGALGGAVQSGTEILDGPPTESKLIPSVDAM